MTTPVPDWLRLVEIKDRFSLELADRIVDSQIIQIESQLVQLRQMKNVIQERMRNIK